MATNNEGGVGFVVNNFPVRSKVVSYNSVDSSPIGMAREVIKRANTPDGFETANILTGDFIFQVLEGDTSTDFLFDEFLASAKISGRLDFTPGAGKFKPFLAVVNIPQITFLPTPAKEDLSNPDFNRRIRNIVTTLGVFVRYNYTGMEFSVPNYGDPVQVTFSDMDGFKNPTFLGPLNTGVVNMMGTSGMGSGGGRSYHDLCGKKNSVSTTVPKGSAAPPSPITSGKKITKFIRSMDQVDVLKGVSEYGTPNHGGNRDKINYEIAIPKNTDKTKPVVVFLMFHGNGFGGDASIKNMITKGPSHMPDGYNAVLIRPSLGQTPSDKSKRTVTPEFPADVISKSGLKGGIETIITFSHSGGGGAHGYYLLQVRDTGNLEGTIASSRFLDSDYGFDSITYLFGLGDFNKSKITFLTNAQTGKPDKYATGKMGTSGVDVDRYKSVYQTGARIIRANISHGDCAAQIGPEYLIPNVVEVLGPGSPKYESKAAAEVAAEAAADPLTIEKKQLSELKTLAYEYKDKQKAIEKKYSPWPSFATTADLLEWGTLKDKIEGVFKDIKKTEDYIAELQKAKTAGTTPPKPSSSTTSTVTPSTSSPTTTSTSTKNDPCSGGNYVYSGAQGEDMEWVKIKTNYGERVHAIPTPNLKYGTKKMEKFLIGLNNVPGGEEFGTGWKPKAEYQKVGWTEAPPYAKPGWYFQDVSLKEGGPNSGHVSHQSGISIDISFPILYTEGGKTFRGMNIGWNPKQKRRWWLGRYDNERHLRENGKVRWTWEDIDHYSFMEFLKYAIPHSSLIFYDPEYQKKSIELMESLVSSNKWGWNTSTPAYVRSKKYRILVADPRGQHANHFHLRLRGPGIAPGPFIPEYGFGTVPGSIAGDGPSPDEKGKPDRIDEGYPGYVPDKKIREYQKIRKAYLKAKREEREKARKARKAARKAKKKKKGK